MHYLLISILQVSLLFFFQAKFLFGGDSAEFSTVAETWSIPHPPGYPLYSLTINLLQQLLPFVTPSIRANLLSIIPTLLTSYIIYKIVNFLISDKLTAVFCSSFYILLFPVWLYAEVPEVFALNNLFIAIITYCIIKYNYKNDVVYKKLIFLFIGLSIAHHHTFILFLPGWFFLLKEKWQQFIKENFFSNIFLLSSGLLLYLYAPLASFSNPPIEYEDSKSWYGLIRLITRASYGSFKAFSQSVPQISNQIYNSLSFFIYLIQDFKITGVLIILVGLISIKHKNKTLFQFIIITFLIELFFLFYTNFPLGGSFISAIFERFLIPIYLLLILPLAYGINFIKRLFIKINKTYINNIFFKEIINYSFYIFLIALLCILFNSNVKSIRYIKSLDDFDTFAKNILDTLPRHSILSTSGDSSTYTTSYYYYVKKYRSDITIIHAGLLERKYYREKMRKKYPYLKFPQTKSKYLENFIKINSENFPVFFESPLYFGTWKPYGLLYKYYPNENEAKKDSENLISENIRLWNSVYRIPEIDSNKSNILQLKSLWDGYLFHYVVFTKFLLLESRPKEAIYYLEKLLKKHDKNNKDGIKVLMLAYIEDNNCNSARIYAKKFAKKINNNESEDLSSILNYYYKCDTRNPIILNYLNQYKKTKLKDDVLLKEL